MSISIVLGGKTYTIPSPSEAADWGGALNTYLIALAAAAGAKSPLAFVFSNSQNDGNATRFMSQSAGQGASAGLPLAAAWFLPVPCAGTISLLQVKLSADCPIDATGGAHSTWTVQKNGVDQLMTVNVNPAASPTGDGGTKAYKTDSTHTFAVVAGDLLSLKWVHSFPGAGSNLTYPVAVVTLTPS